MLGSKLYDPQGIESDVKEASGLDLLPITTIFEGTKETHRVKATVIGNHGLLADSALTPITGYEIHMGRTYGENTSIPFKIIERSDKATTREAVLDGSINYDGNVFGTYIHGLFHNVELRQSILRQVASMNGIELDLSGQQMVLDQEYDKLADWVRSSLDMDLIYSITGLSPKNDAIKESP